jgi:hypothetical protein
MKSMSSIKSQSGAVSLFVVIFAILLMSVVTISFLRIMTNDQNQASKNDLSQSAYDSSQAGVEDAKRALIWYADNCSGSTPAANCNNFLSSIAECNTSIKEAGVIKAADIIPTGGAAGTGEVRVQQSTAVNETGQSTDSALNQAYTCVTMQLDTPDYIGNLSANQSTLVPLVPTAATNRVKIEWFSRDDVSNTTGAVVPSTTVGSQPLLRQSDWPTDRPSVLRTQFMQVGNSFKLSDFDTTTSSSQSNANTLFLYPTVSGNTATSMVSRDSRRDSSGDTVPDSRTTTPLPTRCTTTVAGGGYACSITLTLPTPVGGGQPETAYLRLTSLYVRSHFRVTLVGAQFKGVQPIVDATGRANDVFRRVQSRIDLYDTSFPYPDAAVDTTNNFCKDFGVTDEPDYDAGTCTP